MLLAESDTAGGVLFAPRRLILSVFTTEFTSPRRPAASTK
jgi:hypothetical protein